MGVTLLLWKWEEVRRNRIRTILAGAIFVMLIALVATASRSGLLMLLVVLVLMLTRKGFPRRAAGVFIVFGVAGLFVASDTYQFERLSSGVEWAVEGDSEKRGGRTLELRGQSAREGLELFFANPAVGVGFGGSNAAVKSASAHMSGMHNQYVLVLADTGVVGMSVLLWFLGALSILLGRCRSERQTGGRDGSDRDDAASCARAGFWVLTGLAAILAYGMTAPIFSEKLFWVWLSVAASEAGGYGRAMA
jgi:O-antigen ligase